MHGHMDVKQNSTAYYDDWLFASIRFFLKKKRVYRSLGLVCMKSVGHKLKISHHNC